MSDKSSYTATHRLMLLGRRPHDGPRNEGVILTNAEGKMIVKVNALPTAILFARAIKRRDQGEPINVVLSDFTGESK